MPDIGQLAHPDQPREGGSEPVQYPDRPHLENSRPIRWDRVALTQAPKEALRALLGELEALEQRARRRRANDQKRLEAALEAVVLDLFWSATEDRSRFLAYPRRIPDYGPNLTPKRICATPVLTVADFLVEQGYAVGHRGSYSRTTGPFGGQVGGGYRSRLRATDRLMELLTLHGFDRGGIGSAPLETTIRLRGPAPQRGATKPLICFRDTPAVTAMRQRVERANKLRRSVYLSVDDPDAHLAITAPFEGPEGEREDWVDPRDHSAFQLYRVFNNGRWDRGGRFYGGWWQRLPKVVRARILIDGEETVELDYKAFQPRLCYDLDRVALPANIDPHLIPGYDHDPAYRDAAKRVFAQLLNSGPDTKLKRPKEQRELLRTLKDHAAFVQAVEDHYRPVSSWLRSERGLEMQFVDSEIADEVMHRLTERDVPCLPIHDSFIVPRSSEALLGRIMMSAYADVISERTGIGASPVISGWSNVEGRD